LSLWSLQ